MSIPFFKSVNGRTLIESHRGSVGYAPENSWSAIKQGYRLGADFIEVDVQLSQDGIPFLRHKAQLPDGRWCYQCTWETLKTVQVENELLPRLDDVLAWACEVGTYLSLDLKTRFSPEGQLALAVIEQLARTGAKDRVMLLLLDHQELFHIKKAHPDLLTRALLRGRLHNYPDYLNAIGADCVNIAYDLFRPADIEAIHAAGIAVALGGLWNLEADIANLDIDIFSHDDPVEAGRILVSAQP
ncbi:MAG: glycerophosphodiester phosphodiesterase [Candidatus Promineifilaceae bacterium]|nr:glycerophosphodiester phosphodiesterase [Anaerolineaceae bacterium]